MEEVVAWLDNHIGSNAATYLSLFIGVVALFFVTRHMYVRVKQSQSVENGIGIQAGRNINFRKMDKSEDSEDK